MPRGRPTRYRPEYANQARQAYQLGACDEDIARFFEIDISTFYRWRVRHADFAAACVIGREFADNRVEMSMYQRAIGFEYEVERVFMFASWTDPLIARSTRRVLGDPRIAMQWLRLRRPKEWREDKVRDEDGDLAERIAAGRRRVIERDREREGRG